MTVFVFNPTIQYVCDCGHSWYMHDGYAHGPNIREWCIGDGYKDVPIEMGPTPEEKWVEKHEVCECREYRGLIPERA